jgi:putative sigma-54 modulation protein
MAVNNVNIQAFNCEINDENRRHIEEKVSNIERLWPKVDEAQIRVTEVRGRYVTEITIVSGGMITRGEERAGNLRTSFDTALNRLEQQLRRHKERELSRRNRRETNGAGNAPVIDSNLAPTGVRNGFDGGDDGDDEEDDDNVVRTKRFALKPMAPEEAVLQMDLLGHNFFVFRDAETNQVSVVYKRQSGGYGLIEPIAD